MKGDWPTAIGSILRSSTDRVNALCGNARRGLAEIRATYATPRLSEIAPAWDGLDDEDLIEREDMVVTVTHDGYIKRNQPQTPLPRAGHAAARGRSGMATPKDEDAVVELFVTSTHNRCCSSPIPAAFIRLKVWNCPKAGRRPRGRPMVKPAAAWR